METASYQSFLMSFSELIIEKNTGQIIAITRKNITTFDVAPKYITATGSAAAEGTLWRISKIGSATSPALPR